MPNINVRIDDQTEARLRRESAALGVSLSGLVRERLTGERTTQPPNAVLLEHRIEGLESQQQELLAHLLFMTRFLYRFLILAKDEAAAATAWEAAQQETRR